MLFSFILSKGDSTSALYIWWIIFLTFSSFLSCVRIASSARHLDNTHILASHIINAYNLSTIGKSGIFSFRKS